MLFSGYAYSIELYTGQENEEKKRPVSEPNLGATANVVVRLARLIPQNMNHRLYFDNYYTSIPLLVYLSKQGIYSLGTVRKKQNSKLQTTR
ncbi:hypothetical protein NQ314_011388 [Rhamnusium bicolor]|uniref:PiggyBac transposable element-derived protein domain-containing protein n=1 Tax=Rhamnusium bicolor TaxID=1586634 RepID=A0AAV8XJL5_9CUCU|nr:hypothetical protein NQ314_011388 [Rhamnusium bicolor]